jgi:methionyl aminopeptidase
MNQEQIESYIKAGKIASETVQYAKSIIKPGIKLSELADKIESKISKLGAFPAFPVNLCINEIAAHHSPAYNSEQTAQGILKTDIGVHVNGAIADTAFSTDLENSEKNKALINSSEKALENALEFVKQQTKEGKQIQINKIGENIHKTITSLKFSPIRNLSGHELGEYIIHAGLTIPNYDNNNTKKLPNGAFAIEPFSTPGSGIVYDGKPSEIYRIEAVKGVRDPLARKILRHIQEKYYTLPFCSRWIIKEFSERAVISLKFLEQAGALHRYPELVEKSHSPVSQAEHTFLYTDKIQITTI